MSRGIRLAAVILALAADAAAATDPCATGLQALKQGELEKAGTLLLQCREARPSEVDPYLWLCAVYQQQKDSKSLYETASVALKKFPGEPRFYLTVATHDARDKRFESAVSVLEEGYNRWPEHPSIRKLLANAHFARGAELLDASNNEPAERHLRRATELAPSDLEARLNLGRALHNQLRYSEALDAFDRVIELNPGTQLARFHRGLSYYSLGEFERAIEDLTAEITATPDYAPSYLVRGQALLAMARWKEAFTDLKIAAARMPQSAPAWHDSARALIQLEQLDEAETRLRKAIEIDPGDPAPLNTLVSVLMRLGRAEEARPLATRAATLARERRSADPGEIRFKTPRRPPQ